MRSLISILFVILLGFLIYTQFIQPPSEELQEIKAIRKEADLAMSQYARALRFMGGLGMDMIGDMEIAISRLKKVKNELQNLKSRLQDETALEKAELLETRINNFIKKNDID